MAINMQLPSLSLRRMTEKNARKINVTTMERWKATVEMLIMAASNCNWIRQKQFYDIWIR